MDFRLLVSDNWASERALLGVFDCFIFVSTSPTTKTYTVLNTCFLLFNIRQ